MSLKGFHIVFIALSIVLALGFAVWLFYSADGNAGMIVGGLLSTVAALGLLIYARKFLAKFRHISST